MIIQIHHLKSLNTESSLHVCDHACELLPVVEVTHSFRAALKFNFETAYFDKLINTLPRVRYFTDFGVRLGLILLDDSALLVICFRLTFWCRCSLLG